MTTRHTAILALLLTTLPAQLYSDDDLAREKGAEEPRSTVPADNMVSALMRLTDSFSSFFSPATSEEYADKAARYIRKREYDRGIEALSKAIEKNSGDAGINYDPASDRQLSDEALLHGKKQVERMLEDRPVMRNHIDKDDLLVRWAIRKFAGEDLGQVIFWDSAPPTQTISYAEHTSPYSGKKGAIRLAKTRPSGPHEGVDLTFEELWKAIVFELHNITNVTEFERSYKDALAGKLTRDEFVAAMFRSEFKAIQCTRAFYCRIYLLWAKEKNLRSEPIIWYTRMWWGGPDAALAKYPRNAAYPWAYYGGWFDKNSKAIEIRVFGRWSFRLPL